MRNDHKASSSRYAVAVLAGAVLLLAESNAVGDAALNALKLCATVIIPSLFPYMVIAGMIVSLGAADLIGKWTRPFCRRFFRLPGESASAILLGALCGFPVGAQTASSLFEQKRLTADEAERLIAIANNTGPAFVIEVVGAHCWGDRGFGLFVYVSQIVTAFLIGTLYARFSHKTENSKKADPQKRARYVPKKDLLTTLAENVSKAALSVLIVSGFVVFFAVVLSLLSRILSKIGADSLLPVVGVLLEFTSGTALSAKLGGTLGAFLTGLAVGWSGISVFAQSKVFTSPLSLRLTPAAVSKAIQGVLTGGAAALYYRLFFTRAASVSTCIPITDTPEMLVLGEVVLLILFCLVPALYEKKERRTRPS